MSSNPSLSKTDRDIIHNLKSKDNITRETNQTDLTPTGIRGPHGALSPPLPERKNPFN